MVLSQSASSLSILFTIFFLLSSLSVFLRVFVRTRKTKAFGADDCFLLASLASYALFTAAGLLSISHGLSTPTSIETSSEALSSALRFWFITEITYIISVSLVRIACALHLCTLAKTPEQRWVLFFIVAVIILCNTAFFLLVLFQCDPVQYIWTGWEMEDGKQALKIEVAELISYIFAGVGAGSDWVLVIGSPWVFWEGEMGARMKGCLKAVMALGVSAGSAALIRIPTTQTLMTTEDFFVDCVPIAIGSILELGLGIMALSAATFRPLYPSFFIEKPKQDPIPPIVPSSDEKRSLESNSTRDSSSVTGAQIPTKTTVQRKASDERKKNVS